jgi:hypothetical protein
VGLTRRDQAKLMAELGHEGVRVVPVQSGHRFRAECSCGWSSTSRATYRMGVEAAIGHMNRVTRDLFDQRDGRGVSRSDFVGPGL